MFCFYFSTSGIKFNKQMCQLSNTVFMGTLAVKQPFFFLQGGIFEIALFMVTNGWLLALLYISN